MARKHSNRSFDSFVLFLHFLSFHRLVYKFERELERQSRSAAFLQHSTHISPELYLVSAFLWSRSLDGYDFWAQVDSVWNEVLLQYSRINKSK